LSSGVATDPKDSKTFLHNKEKSFSKILYKFLYETEIVNFQKILARVEMLMLYSSEGGRKDKTKKTDY
jgi:hypothetical protein